MRSSPAHGAVSRRTLFAYFARLGVTGFGGPLAHVAMMEEGTVRRRAWVTPEEFASGVAVCQMLPGPVSTQLSIYIGYLKGGLAGALAAGAGFVLPAYLLVVALSSFYWRYGTLPAAGSLLLGVNAAVIALIAAAALRMARPVARGPAGILIVAAAFTARAGFGIDEAIVLIAAGAAGALVAAPDPSPPRDPAGVAGSPPGARAVGAILAVIGLLAGGVTATAAAAALTAGPGSAAAGADASIYSLAACCLKAGALLFGGGYVIVPLMESQVVSRYGWMTRSEFIDGVAIGQMTPGPILLTVAFVGYRVAGWLGSAVATISAFLPSFLWILLCAPQVPRLHRWRRTRGFLAAVTPAAVGTIAASAWSLGRASIAGAPAAVIAAAVFLLAVRGRVNTSLLLLAAAAAGGVVGAIS